MGEIHQYSWISVDFMGLRGTSGLLKDTIHNYDSALKSTFVGTLS